MICKFCKESKTKQPVDKGTHVRFVDENNRLWNGKTCPDCYKIYNRERMRKVRNNLKKENHKSEIQDI